MTRDQFDILCIMARSMASGAVPADARRVVAALNWAGYAIVPKEANEAILDVWHDSGLGDASRLGL